MNQTTEYFEKNGYVVLKDALSKEQCGNLTDHMFQLYQQGKLVKDSQCPLSDAVYGDSLFDGILQNFAKPIGDAVGRTLLPTYTYARIYRTGEILKRHKDRPSCEISATLTLGFDSKPIWPIFMDEDKEIGISLDVGELVVYKGCDIVHWRPPFKGEWHIQVFLHYVDANGPYKDHVKDGRSDFGVQKDGTNPVLSKPNDTPSTNQIVSPQFKQKTKFPKPIFNSVIIPSDDNTFPGYFCIDKNNLSELRFTDQECDRIINLTKQIYPSSASVGGTHDNSKIAREVRSANIFVLENDEENKWIYEKISNIVSIVNSLHFDYDISGITHGIQLIQYTSDSEIQGHYNWHVDSGPGDPSYRKISISAQLSDANDYRGCELLINNHAHEIVGSKERGSVHLFPSYMLHKVSPITSGLRYALVIWIHGPKRFK